LDYRRRWQENRLRKTRRRVLLGLGVCVLAVLVMIPLYLHGRRGEVWRFTPQQPGLVHFGTDGQTLLAVWGTGEIQVLDLATGRPRVASAFSTPFPLLSEPLVAAGQAFFGCDDGRVRALDLRTGALLWEFATGAAVRARPVLAGGLLLVGSDDGYLYCLQAADGTPLWRLDCGGELGAEPALCGAGQLVLGTVGGGLVGAQLELVATPGAAPLPTAQARWQLKTWGPASKDLSTYSNYPALAPAVAAGSGRVAVVGTDEGRAYLLDPASGVALGELDFPGPVRQRPAVLADRVVAADSGGTVRAANLEGQPLWSRRVGGPITAGLAANGSAVYLATGQGEILALRGSDGRCFWHRRLPGPAAGSLALTDRLIMVGLADGTLCAFPRPPER
jgi:outer membrane protein assembly factor BamB